MPVPRLAVPFLGTSKNPVLGVFRTVLLLLLLCPPTAWAVEAAGPVDLLHSPYAVMALALFVIGYGFVMAEEFIHLRKSKPMLIVAGLIWVLVALAYQAAGVPEAPRQLVMHNLAEYAEILLFLLVAMTFINTLEERRLFDALRVWLASRGFTLRGIFWVTGVIAFFLSAVADNLTTALIMGAVVVAVGRESPKFLVIGCINVVVAANAGGAFSPFGDITTLMVWQKGVLPFFDFFVLFLPSLVNWLVPAVLMTWAVPHARPEVEVESVRLKPGTLWVMVLFAGTIATAVLFNSQLDLPPVMGMMLGLGALKVLGYFLRQRELRESYLHPAALDALRNDELAAHLKPRHKPFDIFISLKRAEWDTLLFFYGVILAIGGLSALGYLAAASAWMYGEVGATTANIAVGLASAVVDNIPIMFAVLTMMPEMSQGQWLLVTLTAGVGGSLLSVGSAAGVALMGQARGTYTFFAHLRWTWAIALGYAASIAVHFWINADRFAMAVGSATPAAGH